MALALGLASAWEEVGVDILLAQPEIISKSIVANG